MFTRLWKKQHKIISNYFKTDFGPRVLISGVNRPFFKPFNFKHTNQIEAMETAKVFHELGYQVDVVNYDNPMAIDYSRYAVVMGSGDPLENLFLAETPRFPRTIFYACGAYSPFSNTASLGRLEALYRRKRVWLPGSARLSNCGLGVERVVDGLVVLGNGFSGETYRAITPRPVHELPLCFLQMVDSMEILETRNLSETRRHFIWFSGTGLVHKGLDLALEAFSRHPELHLHVYGDIEQEDGFIRAFQHELRELPNVHVEGFLALNSPQFRAALLASAFILCPSCAEGCSSSVLNICGNGGQIPLLTRECGIELKDFGILIRDTTVEAVEAALLEADALSDAELRRRSRGSAAFFRQEHSLEQFHQRMKRAIESILSGKEA
jgi:glycosyltransferase involved in cell wall biosynthesis